MKKIINLLLCLTSACLMMAVSSCSHPSSSSSGSSSGDSSKKYDFKVEFVSAQLFGNTESHVYYITKKVRQKLDTLYACYSDPDCTQKLSDDVIKATDTADKDGTQLRFKKDEYNYYVSFYTDGDKNKSYSYYSTNTSKWDISSLKVNSEEYKKSVDFKIEIVIDKPENLACSETWYLMINYDGPVNLTYNYLIFTDEACSKEKVFSSGTMLSSYADLRLNKDDSKLYLVIGSDTITIKLNSDDHLYNAPGSIGIELLKINGTQYQQEVN